MPGSGVRNWTTDQGMTCSFTSVMTTHFVDHLLRKSNVHLLTPRLHFIIILSIHKVALKQGLIYLRSISSQVFLGTNSHYKTPRTKQNNSFLPTNDIIWKHKSHLRPSSPINPEAHHLYTAMFFFFFSVTTQLIRVGGLLTACEPALERSCRPSDSAAVM